MSRDFSVVLSFGLNKKNLCSDKRQAVVPVPVRANVMQVFTGNPILVKSSSCGCRKPSCHRCCPVKKPRLVEPICFLPRAPPGVIHLPPKVTLVITRPFSNPATILANTTSYVNIVGEGLETINSVTAVFQGIFYTVQFSKNCNGTLLLELNFPATAGSGTSSALLNFYSSDFNLGSASTSLFVFAG